MVNDGKQKGYMTLEASLIMPFVFYICLFIIYIGFLLYDRCLIMQDCYRIALRGSSTYGNNNQDVYNTAYDYMRKVSYQKYITNNYNFQIQVNKDVTVRADGKYIMPLFGVWNLNGKEIGTFYFEEKSKCIKPTIVIRLFRELQDKSTRGE